MGNIKPEITKITLQPTGSGSPAIILISVTITFKKNKLVQFQKISETE